MTVQEAIKHYEYGITHDIFSEPVTTYAKMSIEALKKQIPKKVVYKPQDAIYQRPYCPNCDKELFDDNYSIGYCECGQRISWEEGGTSD